MVNFIPFTILYLSLCYLIFSFLYFNVNLLNLPFISLSFLFFFPSIFFFSFSQHSFPFPTATIHSTGFISLSAPSHHSLFPKIRYIPSAHFFPCCILAAALFHCRISKTKKGIQDGIFFPPFCLTNPAHISILHFSISVLSLLHIERTNFLTWFKSWQHCPKTSEYSYSICILFYLKWSRFRPRSLPRPPPTSSGLSWARVPYIRVHWYWN
jgi:hypothetical protein